jgi:hypothetical protein
VSVLRGNGNGTFHSAVNFAVGTRPNSVAVVVGAAVPVHVRHRHRETQGMASLPVHAAVWTAQGGQPFDPEGDLLNPAAIEAYFAHHGFAGSRKRI